MPLSHVTKLYAVKDCKIYKMLTDPAGGTSTYSTATDVPGIKAIGPLTQAMNPKYLKGDNTLLDADVTLSEPWTGKIVGAKVSLDVEAVLTGGTITDTGTTPNQISTIVQSGGTATSPSIPNYFKLEAVGASQDIVAGDVHLVLWKVKIISANFLGFADEDYVMYDFDIAAVPRLSDGQWYSRVINETAVAIT